MWAMAVVSVGYGHLYTSSLISQQQTRNSYLSEKIKKLDVKLSKIRDIRKQKQALIDRMDVIQQLQGARTRVVHIFDVLARNLPKGVYFTHLKKNKDELIIRGYAQSNARISALMNRLESSAWLVDAKLNVINSANKRGASLSQFTINIKQQKQRKKLPNVVAQH